MTSVTWSLVTEMSEVDMIRLAALRAEVRLTHSITRYRLVRWGGSAAHGRGTTVRLQTEMGSGFTKTKNMVRMVAVPDDFRREGT